jgi:carbamoyl-phosphate synthase/aspartate carbamoyltransferase
MAEPDMVLELADGLALSGNSFGAIGKSVAGECVFQTGEFLAAAPFHASSCH